MINFDMEVLAEEYPELLLAEHTVEGTVEGSATYVATLGRDGHFVRLYTRNPDGEIGREFKIDRHALLDLAMGLIEAHRRNERVDEQSRAWIPDAELPGHPGPAYSTRFPRDSA